MQPAIFLLSSIPFPGAEIKDGPKRESAGTSSSSQIGKQCCQTRQNDQMDHRNHWQDWIYSKSDTRQEFSCPGGIRPYLGLVSSRIRNSLELKEQEVSRTREFWERSGLRVTQPVRAREEPDEVISDSP
jgi:hypothetical protein